jgi:hypothetical protein
MRFNPANIEALRNESFSDPSMPSRPVISPRITSKPCVKTRCVAATFSRESQPRAGAHRKISPRRRYSFPATLRNISMEPSSPLTVDGSPVDRSLFTK